MMNIFITTLSMFIFSSLCYANDVTDHGMPLDDNNSYVSIHSSIKSDNFSFNLVDKINIQQFNLPSCQDMQLNFKRCNLSMCYSDTLYGKIYRKTISNSKNKCKYVERSENFGGLDCEIPNLVSSEMELSLDKIYSSYVSPHEAYSDMEASQLKEFIEKYCKVIPHKTIPISFNVNKSEDELTKMINQLPKMVDNTPIAKKNPVKKQPSIVKQDDSYFKSVFFKDTDIDIINRALKSINRSLTFIDGKVSPEEEVQKAAPEIKDFHLNSIIFFSPQTWTIWLNDKKIAQSTLKDKAFSIDNVTYGEIELRLPVNNLDTSSPQWQSKVTEQRDGTFADAKKAIKIKSVMNDEGYEIHEIYITLKPDQTFKLKELSITEGKKE